MCGAGSSAPGRTFLLAGTGSGECRRCGRCRRSLFPAGVGSAGGVRCPGGWSRGCRAVNFVFRPARPADYSEVRRITREAYLQAGHFTADHRICVLWTTWNTGRSMRRCGWPKPLWRGGRGGYASLRVEPYSEMAMDNELEFRMLAVDPAVQGGGVERAVVLGRLNTRSHCRR